MAIAATTEETLPVDKRKKFELAKATHFRIAGTAIRRIRITVALAVKTTQA